MSSQSLESKRFYMEKVQKTTNKICFQKCFDRENGLNKDCYVVCYDKFLKTLNASQNKLKELSKKNHTSHYFKLFAETDPFMYVTFDPSAVEYKSGRPDAVFCKDFGRDKQF